VVDTFVSARSGRPIPRSIEEFGRGYAVCCNLSSENRPYPKVGE
jgi:hypothetical protein